jgi:hypothetical protein
MSKYRFIFIDDENHKCFIQYRNENDEEFKYEYPEVIYIDTVKNEYNGPLEYNANHCKNHNTLVESYSYSNVVYYGNDIFITKENNECLSFLNNAEIEIKYKIQDEELKEILEDDYFYISMNEIPYRNIKEMKELKIDYNIKKKNNEYWKNIYEGFQLKHPRLKNTKIEREKL